MKKLLMKILGLAKYQSMDIMSGMVDSMVRSYGAKSSYVNIQLFSHSSGKVRTEYSIYHDFQGGEIHTGDSFKKVYEETERELIKMTLDKEVIKYEVLKEN